MSAFKPLGPEPLVISRDPPARPAAPDARADLWATRVRRLKESGLSLREFANEYGLDPNVLARWRWRLSPAGQRALAARPRSDTTGIRVAFPREDARLLRDLASAAGTTSANLIRQAVLTVLPSYVAAVRAAAPLPFPATTITPRPRGRQRRAP